MMIQIVYSILLLLLRSGSVMAEIEAGVIVNASFSMRDDRGEKEGRGDACRPINNLNRTND